MIAEERDKFHLVIKNISEGIIVTDENYLIYHINSPLLDITGLKEEKLLQTPLKKHLKEVFYSSIIQNKAYYKSDIVQIMNQTNYQKRIIQLYYAPIIVETGKKVHYVFTLRDITREKEIEEMKNQFVSNVSHELRTPLSSIKGFTATLMARKKLTEEQKEKYLRIIDEESDRLTRLIENLLSLSRIESESYELKLTKFNIYKILERICEELNAVVNKKNIKIKTYIDLSIPLMIADHDQIFQLLLNIINNAIKFTYENTAIEIRINYDRKQEHFIIRITDHGPGIAPENHKNIFEKFYRIEDTVHTVSGTGLGLAIASTIAQKHHGHIAVESELQQGATFIIYLPQGQIKENEAYELH